MRWFLLFGLTVQAVNLRGLRTKLSGLRDTKQPGSPFAPGPFRADPGYSAPLRWYVSNATTQALAAANVSYPVEECTPLNGDGPFSMTKEYELSEGGAKHLEVRNVSCAEGYLPTRGLPPANITCFNGTWHGLRIVDQANVKPEDVNCQSEEQVKLLKAVMHYLDYTNKTLIDTESRGFEWTDSLAAGRKGTLKQCQGSAVKVINDTTMDIWPEVDGLNYMIKCLVDNNMEPRGVPFSEETCQNFQDHSLYHYPKPEVAPSQAVYASENVPPTKVVTGPNNTKYTVQTESHKSVDWSCSRTVQKTGTGWDYMNAVPVILYRVGCYCESKLMLGCPMKWPMYKHFGFESLEQKEVTGAGITALCWYWSNPVHPEWGYLADEGEPVYDPKEAVLPGPAGLPDGVSYHEAPLTNSTQLLR
jgi:hypothetical protein